MRTSWPFYLLVLIGFCYPIIASSQLSINTSIAQHFPILHDDFSVISLQRNLANQTILKTGHVSTSFGAGQLIRFSVDYRIQDLSLGVSYSQLLGTEQSLSNRMLIPYQETTIEGKTQRLEPYIQLYRPIGGKKEWLLYLKLGGIVAMNTETMFNSYGIDFGGRGEIRTSHVSTGPMSFGMLAGIGFSYDLNKHWALSFGLEGNFYSYRPERSELVVYQSAGADLLSSLSVRERVVEYVDIVDQDTISPPNPSTEPSQRLTTTQSFSSIGIELGVKYYFVADQNE